MVFKFVISSQRSDHSDHNPLKFNTEASLFITFKYLETKETKDLKSVIQLSSKKYILKDDVEVL